MNELTAEQESRAREIKEDCRRLPMWAACKIVSLTDQVNEMERLLDFALPSWRTPRDDGHDLEVATIGLQREELKQLRARVAELEGHTTDQADEIDRWQHGPF